MKFSNPRSISLFTASITTVVAIASYCISSFFLTDIINIFVIIILTATVFPITYLILFNLLNTFIWNKIKVIYKNIHNLKLPKNSGDKKYRKKILEEHDIIEKVNEQVIEWSQSNIEEITQLKKLEKYRREFIGNVSHELKTPIFNIQGYVLTLLDGGLSDPEINREYLLRTEKSIDRMVNIINDLDAITKLESVEHKLKFILFDILELVQEVFDFLEIKAKEKNIKLFIGSKSDKPSFVIADRESIKQVLTNLIVNSLKYGIEGGRTKISFYDMDEHLLIEVSDNGIGIMEEDINRVFERFYRTDKARALQQKGSGLGLSIVKHIIEAHNQTINVRSAPDVGTTFSFTLKKAN